MAILDNLWLTKIGLALMLVFGFGGMLAGTVAAAMGNPQTGTLIVISGISLMWAIGYPLAVAQPIWRGIKILLSTSP